MNNLLSARHILNLSEEDLWLLDNQYPPKEKLQIQFDDVISLATIREVIVSRYFWNLHVLYPELPLLAKHCLGETHMQAKTPVNHMTTIMGTILETYPDVDMDALARNIYITMNVIYNMVVAKLASYVDTMDARDYIEVLYHPDINAARERCISIGTAKAIEDLYDRILDIVSVEGFLPGNSLIEDLRQKLSSTGQVLQFIGMIGYRTDIDSSRFDKPIMESFTTGLNKIGDFMKESRSASKALMFQKDPIRTTEYFNRRLQLLLQTVRYLVPGDCGSTETIPWEVQPDDLKALTGKYYIDEEDGKLYSIRPKSVRSMLLQGKMINLRSPTRCKLTSHNAVCEVCAGRIASMIPKGTNLGHVAAYTMGEKITQTVLSVKHLDGSTKIREIDLDENDRRYVRLSTDRAEIIKFQKKWKGKEITLLLPVEHVTNITQAMAANNLNALSIFKISRLWKVGVRYLDDDETVFDWVTVSGPSRPSSLTHAFLSYIKEYGYVQENPKYLEVSLTHWDFDQPVFQLPQKQINMLDFMNELSNMIEGSAKETTKKGLNPGNRDDISAYLRSLHEFCSEHISIPLTYLEIATLALLIRSEANNDYRLIDYKDQGDWASSSSIMLSRSVGSALAYEEQLKTFLSQQSYDKKHRQSHPIDAIFLPNLDPDFFKKWYPESK